MDNRSTSPETSPRRPKSPLWPSVTGPLSWPVILTCILAGVWVAAWGWISRYNLLDDALIHLRYASEHLELDAFDRATPIFSSSLAYDLLIAAAFWVLGSPLTTKILSLLCYFALLLPLAWLVLRTAGFARSALAELRTRCTRTAFSICQPGGPNTSHERDGGHCESQRGLPNA